MPNPYFQFKQFTVYHDRCAMKVTTDACLFGGWCAEDIKAAMNNNEHWANKEYLKLLDIGTGTGLLSMMIAQKNKVYIDAVEIDEEAANQAKQNVKESPFAHSIAVYNSDIANWNTNGYDVIISNPPFYENEIPSTQKQKNIAHHSEELRLETLFSIIYDKLSATGTFYLLLPFKRKGAIDILLKHHLLFKNKEIVVYPSELHQPFRLLIRGSKHKTETYQTEHLSIYDSEKKYTPAFTTLLKDYYLYL